MQRCTQLENCAEVIDLGHGDALRMERQRSIVGSMLQREEFFFSAINEFLFKALFVVNVVVLTILQASESNRVRLRDNVVII